MLPIERQQQILAWLEQEGTLRVSVISKRLDVSEMTVYRDLQPLIEKQKVHKTSNGITLTATSYTPADTCAYCYKNANTRMAFQIIKKNQQVEQTCCAHCGLLRYRDIQTEVAQIICRDYLKDTTISAKMAIYLLKADIQLNCCEPQAIAFDNLTQAKQFQAGFGGEICNFEQAIDRITAEMNGSGCCN